MVSIFPTIYIKESYSILYIIQYVIHKYTNLCIYHKNNALKHTNYLSETHFS